MAVDMKIVNNGIKIINNRVFKASPDYTIPNRFKVSINTPTVTNTDTALLTTVPIMGAEIVDACNVITGWSVTSGDSISVNTITYKPDGETIGGLNIIKASTSSTTISVEKTTISRNGTNKDLLIWIYIKDATTLAKFNSSGTCCTIKFGSDSSNYYYKDYNITNFSVGWNFLKIPIPSGFTGTTSSPTITALNYFYISFITNNINDTFMEGDIVIDAIRVASANNYYKEVDSISFDDTDLSVSIVSKLTVSEANGFLLDGHGLFNTDANELLFSKSQHVSNSKDVTDLFKYTTKIKFRNIY